MADSRLAKEPSISMRVTVRTVGADVIVLGAGEHLVLGRAPEDLMPADDPASQLIVTTLTLPRVGTNVSRLLGEVVVGHEAARLYWRGRPSAQLSSLFEAQGGARRVTLTDGAAAMLDAGENHVLVLRGRAGTDGPADLAIEIDVDATGQSSPTPYLPSASAQPVWQRAITAPMPGLEPFSDVWFVALALAEPWLTGGDDYPRPPTNREIAERVLAWRGDAGRLAAPQRVHDAIQHVAVLAFGAAGHLFRPAEGRRVENARYAVGRRVAEVGLVTVDELVQVEREARVRRRQG